MTTLEALIERRSVRSYLEQPIERETVEKIHTAVADICAESGLKIVTVFEEPAAFDGKLIYGSFKNCKNYFVIVDNGADDETVGYYGQKLVLICQQLGLNTCWVGGTVKGNIVRRQLSAGEKQRIVIAFGYGAEAAKSRKTKKMDMLCRCNIEGEMPDWFRKAMQCAMLAPTAVNQQRFRITLEEGDVVKAKALPGMLSKLDLGIVKYNFEVGAGDHPFTWK